MGSYVVFDLERPDSFQVVEVSPRIPARYYVMGGAAVLAVLFVTVRGLVRRGKRRRSGGAFGRKKAGENPKDDEGTKETGGTTEHAADESVPR